MPDFDQFVAEMESGKWDESRNEVTGMRSRARLWVRDRGFIAPTSPLQSQSVGLED